MHLSQLFDVDKLEKLINDGFIIRASHDKYDLHILNYNAKCAYERLWNPVTLQCRGLVVDGDYNVIARPMPKFFNIEERSRSDIIWKRPFQVFEKLDGSCAILVPTPDGHIITTRGSFHSQQAGEATKLWQERYAYVPVLEDYTYIFEYIAPWNRIVCDYGSVEDLFFLTAIHIETGANLFEVEWPGPIAQRYDPQDIHPRDLTEKLKLDDNTEGFVLYFPHANERVKAKFEEYKRLHKVVTGTSTKTVWQYLSEGRSTTELYERVPDEFYDWLRNTQMELVNQFDKIYDEAHEEFRQIFKKLGLNQLSPNPPRKEFAQHATKTKYPSMMFRLYDDQPIDDIIWKEIKPEFSRPFSVDIDA